MSTSSLRLISYSVFRQQQRTHYLRQYEIPVEHAVSLPLPTLRWGVPAYVSFAAPALRPPHGPTEQDAPDRWWAIDAVGASLLAYTTTRVMPLAEGVVFTRVVLPLPVGTIEEIRTAVNRIEQQIDPLAHAFFMGQPGDHEARYALLTALESYVSAPLLPQYRALSPDFFAWLVA